MKNPDNVASAPDSGMFFEFLDYQQKQPLLKILVQNNYKLANIDEKTPMTECNKKHLHE